MGMPGQSLDHLVLCHQWIEGWPELEDVGPMALDLRLSLMQCRLLLRKSRVTFAERKTTLIKTSAIGRQPRPPDPSKQE